jgi:hypothetical protein
LCERPVGGGPGEYKEYVLLSPTEMTLDEMAQVAHRRPRVERYSYENGKGEAGWSDYQGRSWPGFHHHLAMVMLALTLLTLQRQPLATRADPPSSTSGIEPRLELPPQTSIPVNGKPLDLSRGTDPSAGGADPTPAMGECPGRASPVAAVVRHHCPPLLSPM